MNIAIIAATELEISYLKNYEFKTNHSITYHTHGVGMMIAALNIQKIALLKPDLILQCGIAGAYNHELQIGETVIVYSDCMGDTGAENQSEILDLFDLNFLNKNDYPFVNGLLINEEANTILLKAVNGITVNTTAGNASTIKLRTTKYNPDIETMEGACLHYICLSEKIKFLQFRGISNNVELRDTSKWKINEAVQSCHQEVIKYIKQLN